MANVTRRSGVGLAVVLTFLLTTLAQENLASLFEATGFDRLWKYTGLIGTALLWVWHVLASPVATHIYTFVAGILVTLLVRAMVENSQQATSPQSSNKPDMSIYDLVDYLTTDTAWAKEKGHISDRMVEHELLDALSTGSLLIYARKYDEYGSTSPLFRIDKDDFVHLRIDLDAIRSRRRDAIVLKHGYLADTKWHDWRVYEWQAEQLWPRWKLTEVKPGK